jgi:hypothetical protein
LRQRVVNLEQLTLSSLKFNVILLRVSAQTLELDTPEKLMRYRLAQHLERGSVTAMGNALQAIARVIAKATGVAGADIMRERAGRRYYVQVKSGPDTANKDIAQNIATLLNSARARDPGAVCMMGVCYGRPEQISGITQRELQTRGVALTIGREFWEFISDDPDCMAELLELAGMVTEERPDGELSFAERVERKLQALALEFRDSYGDELDDDAWERFLSDNS